jgi:hypothetical protein
MKQKEKKKEEVYTCKNMYSSGYLRRHQEEAV